MPQELADADEADVMRLEDEYLAIGDADFTEYLRRKTRKPMASPRQFTAGYGKSWHEKDTVTIGGIIRRVSITKTKAKKEPMAFVDVGNQSDLVSVTVFPRQYAEYGKCLKEGELAVVVGSVNNYGGKIGLLADTISIYRNKAEMAELQDET